MMKKASNIRTLQVNIPFNPKNSFTKEPHFADDYTEVHRSWPFAMVSHTALKSKSQDSNPPQFDPREGTLNYYVSVLSETEHRRNTKGRILPGKITPSFTVSI